MTRMDTMLRDKARAFADSHKAGSTLLLPNAWDAWSARIFEEAGFAAIGTTSGGIAYSRGYADGQRIGRDEMLGEVGRIVSVVRLPVTADVEAGYGPTPEDVALTVRGVIAAGAVGLNLEDSTGDSESPLFDVQAQTDRLAAARDEAQRAGIPLFINARIDTYLAQVGEPEHRFAETVRRAHAYLEAGADGVFVPFAVDRSTVEGLVQEIPGPLNVMAMPGGPSVSAFFAMGVTRVSIGASATLAAMGLVWEIASELRESGAYANIERNSYGFAEAQALFSR
jgi:2-methylisocitrate lyase-like PEP mutase family enzyme